MGKELVIVESPAKARTVGRFLGPKYEVVASMGHVRDLPKGKLGIDVEKSFSPSYSVMKGKAAIIKELKALGENASSIYLATDPDREGEAISWHVVNATGWDKQKKNIRRVVFHEITETAIKEALNHKGFILLTLGFFVCGFNITLVSAHIPMYIQERGFEIWTATAILSLIGLFNVFGTLTFGYLSGKYSKKILLSILYFARGIVLILFLILPTSTYVAIGFGVLYGFLWLATIPPTNGIISQIFGTKYLATLYGIVFFSHQIGSFLGAYLGGYFYDEYGSFDYAWYLSIALSFFATLVHLPIDEKPLPRLATV